MSVCVCVCARVCVSVCASSPVPCTVHLPVTGKAKKQRSHGPTPLAQLADKLNKTLETVSGRTAPLAVMVQVRRPPGPRGFGFVRKNGSLASSQML